MKNYTEIKTFEDACKAERLDPKKVVPDFKAYPAKDMKAMIAHAKLIIIARALNKLANGGKQWKPDWNNGQWDKYYPWFEMGGSSGFRFDDFGRWYSGSFVGSRLCFVMDKNPIIDQQMQDIQMPFDNLPEEKKKEFINDLLQETSKALMTTFYVANLKTGMNASVINERNGDKFILSFTKIK